LSYDDRVLRLDCVLDAARGEAGLLGPVTLQLVQEMYP
jgi:hypothetical protein